MPQFSRSSPYRLQIRVMPADEDTRRAMAAAGDRRVRMPPTDIAYDVQYTSLLRMFCIRTADGETHYVGRDLVQDLWNAPDRDVVDVRVGWGGSVIYWPALDFYIPVRRFLNIALRE